MMARPVPSKEREANESWKRSTEKINTIYDNHFDDEDKDVDAHC